MVFTRASDERIGKMFTMCGLVFMAVIIIYIVSTSVSFNKFIKTAVKTKGIISDIVSYNSHDEDNSKRYDVSVRFTTENQEHITAHLDYSEYSSSMYVGKIIEIYYDPLNPSKIKREVLHEKMPSLLMFIGFGLVLLIVGIVFNYKAYVQNKIKKEQLIS